MRIVIDLQGAQAESRIRGMGRYSLSLALSIVRNRSEHEVLIALSELFPETIEPIRAHFDGLLPQENIRVWTAPGPVSDIDPSNTLRRQAVERVREAFLASLKPDIVLVSSLFEGLVDDAVTSIKIFSHSIPTAIVLYDLIPFIHSQPYLENPVVRNWYLRKIDHLRRADLWLAISESSRIEGIDHLGLPENLVVNISTAADDHFKEIPVSPEDEQLLRQKYGLTRPFLMYTGGIDHRKNIEGLIRAFARLPENIRQAHQLAVVCSVQLENRRVLENLARQQGLDADTLILTGFVPEDDLVALYNLCKLFVFPSWHEGFGLPALEAMRCGAPVIAANTSSLPEVIGQEDALFDPYSEESIAAKITEVLTNDSFRKDLILHSAVQAKKFSWDESAKRAIAAFERFFAKRQKSCKAIQLPVQRPKLAYISPLPPERSGIADYSAELLPELSRHYDIEVIVSQPKVSDSWIKACLPIRTVEYFMQYAHSYDRILYHFGNSLFHQHMFDLLDHFPGVVVLHDFFLSSVKAHLELSGYFPGVWACELYKSHGYASVWERFHAQDTTDVIFKYPCNFSILQQAIGVIVHSAYSVSLAREWFGDGLGDYWEVVPHLRVPARGAGQIGARKRLGLNLDDFVVCSFGILSRTKRNHRLLRTWLNSKLEKDPHCRLIFVGETDSGDYGRQLLETIRHSGLGDRIRITGWVDADAFRHYLAAADVAVQLRSRSRGETSGTVLDCMNYCLPTIVNASGSIAELPQDAVWMLPDEFKDVELIEALETLHRDPERRQTLGSRAREVILTRHAPRDCAEQYARSIEAFYAEAQTGKQALVNALARLENVAASEGAIASLATAISKNQPMKRAANQLLVDISELVQHDAKSGNQRLTRRIIKELIHNPPAGYRVEPVYATTDSHGYRYARKFTLGFLDCPSDSLADDLVEAHPGDIFLGLDLQPDVVVSQLDYLKSLHRWGIRVYFVVYDISPILLPQNFPKEVGADHTNWLNAVVQFDGVLCISRTVAEELTEWLKASGPKRQRPFKIDYFYPGADVDNSLPSSGLSDGASQVLAKLTVRPCFLMVGTIEPRKRYDQALKAFEQLWAEGVDANLVIVGKQGWMVEKLVESIRNHSEQGKRLFWLENISNAYLEKVYAASTCLIAASEGEGFGLPLIEAAQHKLPIIARDIPVFREVAGKHAFYFTGKEPADLAKAVHEWLKLYQFGQHLKSDDMPWLTWKQSVEKLKGYIYGKENYSY